MIMLSRVLALVLLVSTIHAQQPSEEGKGIYGVDNRQDVYELPADDPMRQLAEKSIVCLFQTESLGTPENGEYNFLSSFTDLQTSRDPDMCSDQEFIQDPAMAFCSGTLIAPDRVLTAGHCVNEETCATTSFVFNYYVTGRDDSGNPSFPSITEDDVYTCRNVFSFNDESKDFAVVQLDRSVDSSKEPAPIENDAVTYSVGKDVVLIGCPSGIPIKIAKDGEITQAQGTDFFEANVDAFAGNSGSGVFEPTSKQVGILVRGGTDYSIRDEGGERCTIVNTIPQATVNSEACTYAYHHTEVIDCKDNSDCTAGTCDRLCPSDSSECTGFCKQVLVPTSFQIGPIKFTNVVSGTTVGRESHFGNANGDAVYLIQVDEAAEYVFTSCDSDFDTMLSILDVNGTVEVTCDDTTDTATACSCPECCSNTTRTALRVTITPSDEKYLLIEGFGPSGEGSYAVVMTATEVCDLALPLIQNNCGGNGCPVAAVSPEYACCDAVGVYVAGGCTNSVSSVIDVPNDCVNVTASSFSAYQDSCPEEDSAASAGSSLIPLIMPLLAMLFFSRA